MTATTTSIKIGQTEQLFLKADPAAGDLSSLVYSATPDGLVTLAQDASGVNVTGVASGVAAVVATVQGEDASGNPTPVTAECDVTVSLPLVRSLTLGPAS